MLRTNILGWLSRLCLCTTLANAITLDTTSSSSIKTAASEVAFDMMKWYTGNNTGDVPGNLPSPYYWWEAGAFFGLMIEYWYYTGDTTYNAETVQAIQHQVGTNNDFMPSNQTKDEGNDDQVFWAFTAMTAAELNFEAPPSGDASWLSLAQAVFNEQAARWDTTTCGGGLRWQIYTFNAGYDYKNSIANGGFFQLAARLARYTDNSTYVDWAEKMWDWYVDSVIYDATTYQVFDGTSTTQNCTSASHEEWTYTYGTFISGLAYLYNHTEDAKWLTPLEGIINSTFATFFPVKMGNKIMVEIECQPLGNCDTDQLSFRAYLSRWLAVTMQLVPTLYDTIYPYLEASAIGAAGQCDGGTDGRTCGLEWNSTTWDGTYGVGQQMSALSIIQSMMINVDATLASPLTTSTGGNSTSNPTAGTGSSSGSDSATGESAITTRTITTGDRAGAGILTAVMLMFTLVGAVWLLFSAD